MKTGQAVVCINTFDSYCRSCGIACNPMEKTHKTNLGYFQGDHDKPGCGIKYLGVTSDYDMRPMKEGARQMRPDLKWVEVLDIKTYGV